MEKKHLDQSERIHTLENKVKDSEQYSRRNCLRIFGIPETKGEKTDDIVLKLAKEKLGVEIDINDIDRSHRTGSMNTSEQRDGQQSHSQDPATSNSSSRSNAAWTSKTDKAKHHRPIIVKFTTYRSRQTVLSSTETQADRDLYCRGLSGSQLQNSQSS